MTPTFFDEIVRFRNARMWQNELMDSPDATEVEREFGSVLHTYIQDLRYRLGFTDPYTGELDRLGILKEAARNLGPMYQEFAEYAERFGSIPPSAQQLLDFLNATSMDLAYRIHTIEQRHPDLKEHFTTERRLYPDSLN